MGAAPSQELSSVTEASQTQERIKNRNEDPKIMEEEVKTLKKAKRAAEEEKKTKEDVVERSMSARGKIIEEPKRSKEELQKAKEVMINKNFGEVKKAPHKYEAIMKEATDKSSAHEGHIHSGIFLDDRKKKYWVEERGYNCFMVFARGLLITWSDDRRFWQWSSLKETSDVEIEITDLLNVCWLEVHGRFETSYLTPGIMYEVFFAVMVKEFGYGWENPVNLRLTLPDGTKQQHKQSLQEKPKGQWIELKVGEFITRPNQAGEMEFSLFEYDGGQWKRGLMLKGAIIRPKK